MNKYEFTRINEVLYHEELKNGLNVFLLPKKGFHKSYVTFSTKLGSIMTKIQDKENNIIDLPNGIAHFLEHKLFEQDGKDVSGSFARNQASVNAFTQNGRTTYLFSCTDKLKENIDLLINFVQNPYFTDKGIEKEKGIIGAEIKMYQDDPNTIAYMGLIRNMFTKHPVRNDILGTIDTISKIDKTILEKAHITYYNPNNMVLFVTGNFEVNDIIAEVDGVSVIELPFYETVGMILGEEGTDVSIGIIRNGVDELINLTMTRSVIDSATVIFESFQRGDQLIGYIRVTTFGDQTLNLFVNAIADLETEGIDGLIVDLRDNGGGHLSTVVNMLNQFLVDDGNPMFSTEYYLDGEILENDYFATRTEAKPYDIVTVVNENSASASEVFASAMQEHGGYAVIGQTTYGKGTMQRDVAISATIGDSLHITIGKWFTSEGNWVHYDGGTDGVTPDVIVEKTNMELAYKLFLFNDETLEFDQVDYRIENLQLILNIMGYTVRTDGYFDTATEDAIKAIQTANLLVDNGIVDNDTLSILNQALDEYQDNRMNDTQLQEALDFLEENPIID